MAKNFGFNIGGGGIADLVATPKITPIRSGQFAPTPQRRTTTEKDPKKQLLGALLGTAAPFAADAALKGLGSLTGLEFYRDSPLATQAQVSTPKELQGPPPIGSTPEEIRQALKRQRFEEIDRTMPQIKTPQTKTGLGNILSTALQYAPAFALAGDDDDGSASAFITAANAARKLDAATEKAGVDAAVKREQSRATAFAGVKPELEELTVNTFRQPDPKRNYFVNYQTMALRDKNGVTWIRSNGLDDFDLDQSGNKVEKGRYYRNPKAAILDGESAAVETKPFQDVQNPDILLQGRIEKISTPDGQETTQITFQDPLNLDKRVTLEEMTKRGYNLTTSIDRFELRPIPSSKKTPAQEQLETDVAKQLNIKALGLAAQAVLDPLMEGVRMVPNADGVLVPDPKSFNNGITSAVPQKIAGVVDSVQRNIINFGDELKKLGITDSSGITAVDSYSSSRLKDDDSALNAAALIAANSKFEAIFADGSSTDADKRAASAQLARLLSRLQSSAVDQDSTLSSLFGGENFLVRDEKRLQEYLNKQGLFAANQIRLAYMAAAAQGEKGRSLSDKDIAFFMATLGFDSGNAEVVSRNVGQFVYQEILKYDQDGGKSSIRRELEGLDQKSEEERELYLREKISEFGSKFRINQDALERLRSETDPKKRQDLVFEIQNKLNDVTGGVGTRFYGFNPKYGIFVPKTLANNFKNDFLLKRLNKYLDQLGYDFVTGTDRMYSGTGQSSSNVVSPTVPDKEKQKDDPVRGLLGGPS